MRKLWLWRDEKKNWKNGKMQKKSIREVWNTEKDLSLNGIRIWKESEIEAETIFKKKVSNEFPELKNTLNHRIKKFGLLYKWKTERKSYIDIDKHPKSKTKGKIFKVARKKRQYFY